MIPLYMNEFTYFVDAELYFLKKSDRLNIQILSAFLRRFLSKMVKEFRKFWMCVWDGVLWID